MIGDQLLFSGYSPDRKVSMPYFYQLGDEKARVDPSAFGNYIFINVQGDSFYVFPTHMQEIITLFPR